MSEDIINNEQAEEVKVEITENMVAAFALTTGVALTPESEPGLRGSLIDVAAGRGHVTVAIALASSELHEVIVAHFKNAKAPKELALIPCTIEECECEDESGDEAEKTEEVA